ncbi:MAG TPA: hypothetical protein VNN17_05745, partial [Terriglobia bacterium]|nr:hypothetical protein [Terriglobia bacterium]
MQADLILAGKSGWSPAQPLGSTALALIAAAPRSFLLVHQETAPAAPILSVYEDSAESRRALELAVRLAEARDTGLVVFLLAATPEAGMTLQQQASEIIGHRLKHARFRRIEREDPVELARLLRSEEDGLLVLSGASLLAEEAAIRKLLELVPNPVLLLRPES